MQWPRYLLLLCASAAAQTPRPDPAGLLQDLAVQRFMGSGTDSITAMRTDSAGYLYVAGYTTSPDLPVKNAFQPALGDTLIRRSTDLGRTWTALPNPPAPPLAITPHPADPKTLVIGAADGIYKSRDAGLTWRLVQPFTTYSGRIEIAIDRASPARAYAYAGAIFYASSDGGETWLASALPPQSLATSYDPVDLLWVDPAGSGAVAVGLLLSKDRGKTWTGMSDPDRYRTQFTAPDPRHSGWIYAGTSNGFYLSKNWGQTWSLRPSPVAAAGNRASLRGIAFDPDSAGVLYASAGFDGLFVSSDDGDTWRALPEYSSKTVILGRRCSGGALLSLDRGRLSASLDHGATWTWPPYYGAIGVAADSACAVYSAVAARGDAFVAKLNPGGTGILWLTYLGGSGGDAAADIAIDPSGNVYVTGNTTSEDFPASTGPGGEAGMFVTKFAPDGTLAYSTVFGGGGQVMSLAVNANGEAHVAGSTRYGILPATPGAYKTETEGGDGYAAKLDAAGRLAYLSYLPQFATIHATTFETPDARVAVAIDATGAPVYGGWEGRLGRMSPDGSSMTMLPPLPAHISAMDSDSRGNLFIVGRQTEQTRSRSCPGGRLIPPIPSGDILIAKLRAEDLTVISSTSLWGDCVSVPSSIRASETGEALVAFTTRSGFEPVAPVLGPGYGPMLALIAADGISRRLVTGIEGYSGSAPAAALAPDGSVYASVSMQNAAILRIPITPPGGPVVSRYWNAFSGAYGPAPGTLLTLTGENLASTYIDLGLNYAGPLPRQLAGTSVLFDGEAAEVMQVAPDRVICVVPAGLAGKQFTSIQLIRGESRGTPYIAGVTPPLMTLLTTQFPSVPLTGRPDGNIRNADGSLNSPDNPAAPGSTVTLFATGVAAPGPIHVLWNVPAQTSIVEYLTGTARHMAGFINALYAIDFQIPGGPGFGVYIVPKPGVLTRHEIGRVGSGVGVYVK